MRFRLHHIKDTCDLHLKPGRRVLENAVSDVQEQSQPWQTFTSNEDKQNISNWLLDGPAEYLCYPVRRIVEERRKQMMMFLLLGYADAASPISKFEVFEKHIGKEYGCSIKPVTSETDMSKEIRSFLAGAGGKVDMPVILVTGKGKTQGHQLILQFRENHSFAAAEIFEENRLVHNELRMVFCCYNNGSDGDGDGGDREIWFTNALLPETVDSELSELKRYLYAILGDGPKNKNIQLPY